MPELVITAAASGDTTLTISATESANHTKPANKVVSVNTQLWPASISDMTPAIIKEIVDARKTSEFLHPGDLTPLIPFKGTVAGQVFDMKIRCRIVHIDEDEHPIFQIAQNEAGQEIALVHSASYNTRVPMGGSGFCMNRLGQVNDTIDSDTKLQNVWSQQSLDYGPNRLGWEGSYGRKTLMPQFLACFPEEWRNVMRTSTVWTDNVGRKTNYPGSITATEDVLYLPGEVNIIGMISNSNSATDTKQTQWDWYAAGNAAQANRHDNPATKADNIFCRDPSTYFSCVFSAVRNTDNILWWYAYASGSGSMRPCFSI